MNKNRYKDAMNGLPFSDDLEARTMDLLKASSAKAAKEERLMEQKPNGSEHKPQKNEQTPEACQQKPSKSRARFVAVGGSMLAAAACLVLILTPMLRQQASDRLLPTNGQTALGSKTALGTQPSAPLAPADNSGQADSTLMEWEFAEEAAYDMDVMADALAPRTAPYTAPEWNTEEYSVFTENAFVSTLTAPLSTFAADVDTASYAKLRASILAGNTVAPDSVRIEEMLNYFTYDYAKPKAGEPFGVTTEIAPCPWNPDTQLLLIGLQAEEVALSDRPAQNLVFLIDVSGSMDEPDKLPLVKRAFQLLLEELSETDTISIVTYAGYDQVVLDGVRASDKTRIMEAIDSLMAGGGTAGAAGIQTAYELASKHFIKEGTNRIILATDGDLNIGISDEGSLTRLIEEKRQTGVYLSVLGFGSGNYKDNKLEALADHGNGNYAYIDTLYEARKALVEEIGGTFLTVAKDVKLQVEFNPAKVKGYRLIGYENRTMAAQDFADDKKDGGEVGSGHRVTVLYELVPVDSKMELPQVETKYQNQTVADSDEWLTLSLRCKKPDSDTSDLYTYPIVPALAEDLSDNMRFASAVAEVGMLLRGSEHKGTSSYESALDRLRDTASVKGDVYKEEFQYLVSLLDRKGQ